MNDDDIDNRYTIDYMGPVIVDDEGRVMRLIRSNLELGDPGCN